MTDGDEANDEILKNVDEKIDELIKDKQASTEDLLRGMLQVMKAQQPYLLQSLADHSRVMTMWRTYKPAVWAAGIALATIITLLLSGKMTIIVR